MTRGLSLLAVVLLLAGCGREVRWEYCTLDWKAPTYDFDNNLEVENWMVILGNPGNRPGKGLRCLTVDTALNEVAAYGWELVGVSGDRYTFKRRWQKSSEGQFMLRRDTVAMPPSRHQTPTVGP